MKNNTSSLGYFAKKLFDNKVTLLFVMLCIASILISGNSFSFVVGNVLTRFGRNTFLVLALIIPVIAGLGLNFGIVIGAIAAQFSLFLVVLWGLQGVVGISVAFLITTPLALLLGYGVGRLFNKMKGAEMIGGLILGYFADGLYQLFFLYILGGVIPIDSPELMIPGGVGVKNTIDLSGTVKYSLDTIKMLDIVTIALLVTALYSLFRLFRIRRSGEAIGAKVPLLLLASGAAYALTYVPPIERFLLQDSLLLYQAVLILSGYFILRSLLRLYLMKKRGEYDKKRRMREVVTAVTALLAYLLTYLPAIDEIVVSGRISVFPYLMIVGLCVFNNKMKFTRLGQNMRTVGQSQVVANASGIDVDKTRVIAMMLSTMFAGWGQLIFLQNLGTFATYGAHLQVGLFAIASILVGGASVEKAKNVHAITGVILFHTLFIVAPEAGKVLFDNAMIGEYFRVFVSYGVIAVALAMHAWKMKKK